MKSVLRILAVVALLAALAATTAPTPVSALSQSEMAVTGGSACSFAEGAGWIFGAAGIVNPGFALVALGIGAGVMIWC